MDTLYSVTRDILSTPLSGSNPRKLFYLPQDVLEWGGRICYKSVAKFRSNPDYLKGIIEVEHYDVLEHGFYGALFNLDANIQTESLYYFAYHIGKKFPFLRVDIEPAARKIGLYGNFRVWFAIHMSNYNDIWGLIDRVEMQELIITLNNLAPQIFHLPSWLNSQNMHDSIGGRVRADYANYSSTLRGYNTVVTNTGANVMLLGKTFKTNFTNRYHASFQISNVTRAMTHQLVRHRLLSFSQQSQRYVDASNFTYIIPDSSDDAKAILQDTGDIISQRYRALRSMKIKKEDARALLPNMTSTEIVVSGEEAGWEHFIKLRTAPDAQYEIREVALAIEKILNQDNGVE